jgi:hypothetical protein
MPEQQAEFDMPPINLIATLRQHEPERWNQRDGWAYSRLTTCAAQT